MLSEHVNTDEKTKDCNGTFQGLTSGFHIFGQTHSWLEIRLA